MAYNPSFYTAFDSLLYLGLYLLPVFALPCSFPHLMFPFFPVPPLKLGAATESATISSGHLTSNPFVALCSVGPEPRTQSNDCVNTTPPASSALKDKQIPSWDGTLTLRELPDGVAHY